MQSCHCALCMPGLALKAKRVCCQPRACLACTLQLAGGPHGPPHCHLFVCRCLGITLSFHRQLSHRAFQTPKWLEYALAYCGVLAVQVPPVANPLLTCLLARSGNGMPLHLLVRQSPRRQSNADRPVRISSQQGDPTEWVSSHRFHHLHTDTPLDPHSPYEGFWWSHMGWLLDEKVGDCDLCTRV